MAFPYPSWIPLSLSPREASGLLESEFLPHENGFFYVQYPKGETSETTDRALISGLQVSALLYEPGKRYPLGTQLEHFADRLIKDEEKTCRTGHFEDNTLLLGERGAIFSFVCSSGLPDTVEGYGPDKGTVALGRVYWRDDVAFFVMNQWWGDAFDIGDRSTWPVSEEVWWSFEQRLLIQVEANIVLNPDWDPFDETSDEPFLKE